MDIVVENVTASAAGTTAFLLTLVRWSGFC